MKQLQHGVYTPALGERSWGEEVNQNFEILDSLISDVRDTKTKCDLLAPKIQDNTTLINNTKDSLQENITNAVNDLQEKIDALNNNASILKDKVDDLSNKDRIEYANEADLAILAVSANTAKKLENSLVIGSTVFDGSSCENVPIDTVVTQGSLNLINSGAVYNGLTEKQDKATTLSGYNITDAYTKSEIDNMISDNDADLKDLKVYIDTKVSGLVNSAPETLDTLNELASALGNDPNFATTIANQIGNKADVNHAHDDRYYTESEIDIKLSGKSDTTHHHNSVYLGISAKAESAKSADSVAWNNISGKPSSFMSSPHTHDDRYYTESEIDTKLNGKSNTDHTHSNYLTGITKAMVTNALGYTPPASDTNTTYSAGSNLSLSGTTFNVSDTPSFTDITINGYKITID